VTDREGASAHPSGALGAFFEVTSNGEGELVSGLARGRVRATGRGGWSPSIRSVPRQDPKAHGSDVALWRCVERTRQWSSFGGPAQGRQSTRGASAVISPIAFAHTADSFGCGSTVTTSTHEGSVHQRFWCWGSVSGDVGDVEIFRDLSVAQSNGPASARELGRDHLWCRHLCDRGQSLDCVWEFY
jgi:hypothetical protein